MSSTTLSARLEKIGLTEKEALVYPALLKLDVATVKELTAETGLNRSSLYVVLDRLAKRGLVSTSSGSGVRKYVPAGPERLSETIRDQSERYELLNKNLKAILPDLISLHRSAHHKPKVTFYEGRSGLIRGFEDSLYLKEPPMRVVSSGPEMFRTLPEYLPDYIARRFIQGMKMVGIHPNEPQSSAAFKSMPLSKENDEHYLIPEEKYNFPADLGIYDDKTVIMSHTHLFTATIKSRPIADLMRTLFDLGVEEARRIGESLP